MESLVERIFKAVIKGSVPDAEASITEAMESNIATEVILNEGLIAAMDEVGKRFECGEYFLPEMMIAGRTMRVGIAMLRPLLAVTGIKPIGKVVIGTIKGDLHDIGKNLVGMMMEGAGFEVIDVGTDVTPEAFLDAVKKEKPNILGMSALLTNTMTSAVDVIKLLEESGVRDQVKVMFGGAPVTQEYVDKIGADGYAPDAASAAKKARALLTG